MKTRRRKTASPNRSRAPKAARTHTPSVADLQREVAALRRELKEALEQQTATSEVLGIISSSPSELEPVFQAMLANATRICEAKFGTMYLFEGDAIRPVALHNAPQSLPRHARAIDFSDQRRTHLSVVSGLRRRWSISPTSKR
jgi:hypothetical protein